MVQIFMMTHPELAKQLRQLERLMTRATIPMTAGIFIILISNSTGF